MNEILNQRVATAMEERQRSGLERTLPSLDAGRPCLDLSNNDYLRISQHPKVKATACEAVELFGTSSSSSPLVTGFRESHRQFLEKVKFWHGFANGVVWNSGYAANQAILSILPQKGDLVLADRLIHQSMVSGILRSGARLIRYPHCDLAKLEALLKEHFKIGRQLFVVTESVFSMDGDYPDLRAMGELKKLYPFFWVVDEAHALGWYGVRGSGLCEATSSAGDVDLLVGTMGKALGSMGAYSLFNDSELQRYLINFSGEFIYSTYLPPSAVAAAGAAIDLIRGENALRERLQRMSRAFRSELLELGFATEPGDSPIVPIRFGSVQAMMTAASILREDGILVGAIRPPTVPKNACRLRLSLNADLVEEDLDRIKSSLIKAREAGCR